MSTRLGSVLVIAKEPIPGRVKTRLTPPYRPDEAAELAGAALRDTIRAAGAIAADQHVLVFEGDADAWAPPGWRVVPQASGGLDARLAAAFDQVSPAGPAILVGMDTPQLRADQVERFAPAEFDACLGMAGDGGYWLIGFADPARATAAITGIGMSLDDTGAQQLGRLLALGLRVQMMDELIDVDDARTAAQVAELAPQSEFAHVLQGMHPVGPHEPNSVHAPRTYATAR